ncbi:MAG: hypothetical protein JNK14_07625 [Chitinophagaceae bacterium]|nr:hypothetical protein [Chitinophagaceae bacterium]
MKIAITDACIFIDLLELELALSFFTLHIDVHTSLNVFNELNPAQKNELGSYIIDGKLTVHNISEAENHLIAAEKFPSSLSLSDRTVLFLAIKQDAMVLSSDKAVRHNAKIRSIEYHGMLWILDQLVEAGQLLKQDAIIKLKAMIASNMIYQNNKELTAEMNKRLRKWG